MMLTFTENNRITKALISPLPIFVSSLFVVAKSRDHHNRLGDVIFFCHPNISSKV